LPPSKIFSSTQAHTKAAGPKKWNQQQGFYIYRNDRMIQSGGWCRIRTIDEHTKLARFAINFTSKIDGAFNFDVSKMYVHLPPQIRKEVEEKTQPLVMQAREIYDNAEREAPVIIPLTSYSDPLPPQRKAVFPVPIYETAKKSPIPNKTTASSAVMEVVPSGKISRTYIIEEQTAISKEKTWTLEELFDALKKDATPSEIGILEKLFNRLREQIQKNDVKK